jgi:alpha-D-xyloside xylohydrolase
LLRTTKHIWFVSLIGFVLALAATPVRAGVEAIESSALRIELNTSPYSLRIIEKSTGDVLLSASRTAFTEQLHRVTAATDVVKASDSIQATLVLAGDTGKAKLRVAFTKPEVVQVTLEYGGGDCASIYEEFEDHGDHYYGVWEYPFGGNIDNRGADFDFGGTRQLPDVNYSNARAPFYMTSRKYGVYVETVAQGHFTFSQSGKTAFSFQDKKLTYDVIYGPSYADVLNRYNAIAGPAVMPPIWAFDSIWWRDDNHEDLRDAANAQDKVIEDADRLRSLHIPASIMWLDRPYGSGEHGWGNMDFDSSFPDPAKMIRDLHDRGMYLTLWIANRCSSRLYQEGSAKGYLFDAQWPAADLRRPEAYDWFKGELDSYVHQGVRGYKIDRGEEDEMPRSFENLHAILMPKLAAEGLKAAYHDEYFEFSRNANDTARKYTAIWNGDTRSTFGGLAVSLKNALRSGAINFPMWGSDTGGYIRVPEKELFARWLEFSAFSPMMEILIGPKRTIWYDYDPELVRIAQTYVSMHHDLIPYTRSYLYQATLTGMPVIRSLIFAYPTDASLYDTWDEYLYGRDLLVAPVVTPNATSRKVYLPAGRWMNYNDRATVCAGGGSIMVDAPLGTLPLFVREGGIIARGDILKSNNNWDANWAPRLRIEIFPANQAASEFAYYTGEGVRKIEVKPGQAGLEIKMEDLGVGGSLEVYCRGVSGVTRNGGALREGVDYQYDAKQQRLTIPFNGASTFTIPGASSLIDSAVAH